MPSGQIHHGTPGGGVEPGSPAERDLAGQSSKIHIKIAGGAAGKAATKANNELTRQQVNEDAAAVKREKYQQDAAETLKEGFNDMRKKLAKQIGAPESQAGKITTEEARRSNENLNDAVNSMDQPLKKGSAAFEATKAVITDPAAITLGERLNLMYDSVPAFKENSKQFKEILERSGNQDLKKIADAYDKVKKAKTDTERAAAQEAYLDAIEQSNKSINELLAQTEGLLQGTSLQRRIEDQAKKNKDKVDKSDYINTDNINKMIQFLMFAGLLGFGIWTHINYANEHRGCTIYKADNTKEKIDCGGDGGWYNKKDENKRFCSCGGTSAIKDGSEVLCSDLKLSTQINDNSISCSNTTLEEMAKAPYCLKMTYGYNGPIGSVSSCSSHGSEACAPFMNGKRTYCKDGRGGWYYSYRETSFWEIEKDMIPFLGNMLDKGLNALLKWVLIIGGVILGGSLVFFIAKRLIFSEIPKKKSKANESENINITLAQPK